MELHLVAGCKGAYAVFVPMRTIAVSAGRVLDDCSGKSDAGQAGQALEMSDDRWKFCAYVQTKNPAGKAGFFF